VKLKSGFLSNLNFAFKKKKNSIPTFAKKDEAAKKLPRSIAINN
jgi:hypothetical protein